MKPINFSQLGYRAQALFVPSRGVRKLGDFVRRLVESKKEDTEKTPAEKKEDAEAPKVKPPGVPIDQPVKPAQAPSDTKRSILEAAVKKVNEEEKKILDKFGGTIVEMDKVPGNEGKDYKNTVFVNAPKNPEKYVDKDGKPIPPRVVYHFHGNGGKIGDSATAIMDQVERMRANGENVILVMPQDNQGHWKDMENPAAFKDMQKMVESMTGGKPIKDISISSFSGGYKGVEKVLKNLRENADKDPESKKLYKNIRQLGFLDAMEGRPSTAGEEIESVEVRDEGPRIPERSPDAMTGAQFRAALRACKTEEEKNALYLDQWAKGNVPDHFRQFQRVKVERGGMTVEFSVAPHGLGIGTADDFVEVAFDGPLAAAAAAGYDCALPSRWLVEQIEKQPQGKRVHFSHQAEFAGELKDEKGNRLNPRITHGARTWSADFILKRDEKIKESAKERGVSWAGLTYGYYKDIVLPERGLTRRGNLGLFGGFYDNGERAQGYSGNFHEETHRDYSQGFRPVAKVIWKNGVKMTAGEARNDPELMADPEIARLIRGMNGELETYDYEKDKILRGYVERMRKGLPAAVAVTTGTPSSQTDEQPVARAEVVPSTTPSASAPTETTVPLAEPSITQPPIAGTPEYTPSSSGSYSGAGASGPSYAPETHGEAAAPASTPESTPESAKEQVETAISNNVFILGASLSMGFAPYLKGPNVRHIHSKKENDSTGAHTIEMLTTLRSKILPQNVEGSTLVIVGGTNDIFNPDSLEIIKKNLNEIYTLAKEKGMKVVAATLPPVGHSHYSEMNYQRHKSRFHSYEDYNAQLIERWRAVNSWIMSRKGVEDEFGKGPDQVVEFHKVLENPDLPGSLTKENYGEGGIHLKDYSVMGNSLRDAVASLNPQEPHPEKPAESAETAKPAARSSVQPTSEQPASKPEDSGPLAVTSETKVDIQPTNNPTKEVALRQNAKIRKNISGYAGLQQVTPQVGSLAQQLLRSRRFGDIVYFTDGTNEYAAIKEWHPPYDSRNPGKPQSWHHGISVVKKNA